MTAGQQRYKDLFCVYLLLTFRVRARCWGLLALACRYPARIKLFFYIFTQDSDPFFVPHCLNFPDCHYVP
uniref:Uncharacterized protein n=1 Tax=Anguilla anguilla TaxID=7936 RepID=A0A0E9U0N8_ANGAN